MRKFTLVCLALSAAVAQPALGAPPAPAAASAPADAERMALARQAVAVMLPPGIMERMMKDSMGNMQDAMLESMFDIKASDLGEKGEGKDKTLREAIAEKDPHFEERMRITNKVMGEEMGAIFTRIEPRMREGMARAYARRFTAAELVEINRFFASPTGASFARQSLEIMTDRELVAEMTAFMPELMKEMPAITAKLKKATEHLPPPPKPVEAEEEQEEEAEPIS